MDNSKVSVNIINEVSYFCKKSQWLSFWGKNEKKLQKTKILPDLALRPSNVFDAIWKSASSGESSIDFRRLEFVDEFSDDRSTFPGDADDAVAELMSHGRTIAWGTPAGFCGS